MVLSNDTPAGIFPAGVAANSKLAEPDKSASWFERTATGRPALELLLLPQHRPLLLLLLLLLLGQLLLLLLLQSPPQQLDDDDLHFLDWVNESAAKTKIAITSKNKIAMPAIFQPRFICVSNVYVNLCLTSLHTPPSKHTTPESGRLEENVD